MRRKSIIGIAFIIFALMFTGIAAADDRSSGKRSSDYEHNKDYEHDKHDDHHENNDHEKFSDDVNKKNLVPTGGLFMTDNASMIPKDDQLFGWNELPHTYMQFDVDDLDVNKHLDIKLKWINESGKVVHKEKRRITDFSEDTLNIWNSADNWDEIKEVGAWTVKAKWKNPHGGKGRDEIHFAVAPEPVSSLLFIAGSIVMAGRGYLRRRKRR
jgi:hypothetical protein